MVPSLPQQTAVELRLSHFLSALEQSLSLLSSSRACFSTAEKGSKLQVLRWTNKVVGFTSSEGHLPQATEVCNLMEAAVHAFQPSNYVKLLVEGCSCAPAASGECGSRK